MDPVLPGARRDGSLPAPRVPQGIRHGLRALLAVITLALVAALGAPGAPPLDASPLRPHYTITARVDLRSGTVGATAIVRYPNRTGRPLDRLVFQTEAARSPGFALAAQVGGQDVTPQVTDLTIDLPLPEPLEPEAAATVRLDFQVPVPAQEGRYGFQDGILSLGGWYPLLAVYRGPRLAGAEPEGWDRHPPPPFGDLTFSEVADYEVTLTVDGDPAIAHTGTLVTQEGATRRYRAEGVREFALALSTRYQTFRRQVGAVEVVAFVTPERAAAGPIYLEYGASMLVWLHETLGPYPWLSLHLAEMPSTNLMNAGQEYPGLVRIASWASYAESAPEGYLAYLVRHEVAHQWFYGIVGNDQIREPWVDEALATWLALHHVRVTAPQVFPAAWQQRVTQFLPPGPSDPPGINRPIYDFPTDALYFNTVYRQGALLWEDLYQRMGDAAFFGALQRYVQVFSGQVATGTALLDLVQAHTDQPVGLLVQRYATSARPRGEGRGWTPPWPPGDTWAGTVVLRSDPGIRLRVVVDDRPALEGDADRLTFDTRTFPPGEYLITLVGVGPDGPVGEATRRVT
ncbi:MAG: M1 family metallopeptidase, partial [Chloroflexi bacterium]|nr:M1 family metallopeptidase [Chloroflexota bacterium]